MKKNENTCFRQCGRSFCQNKNLCFVNLIVIEGFHYVHDFGRIVLPSSVQYWLDYHPKLKRLCLLLLGGYEYYLWPVVCIENSNIIVF